MPSCDSYNTYDGTPAHLISSDTHSNGLLFSITVVFLSPMKMCFGKKKSAFSASAVELQKNEEIDKMIRKDKKKMKKEIKILLLGKLTILHVTRSYRMTGL